MPNKEKIYTCEVKKQFIRNGNKVRDWKIVDVADAIRVYRNHDLCRAPNGDQIGNESQRK